MMQVLALVIQIIRDIMPGIDESVFPEMVERMNIRLQKVAIYHTSCGRDMDCAFKDIQSDIDAVPGTQYRPVRKRVSEDEVASIGWNWSRAYQQLTLNGFSDGKDGMFGYIKMSPEEMVPFSRVTLLYNFAGPNGLFSELYSRRRLPPDIVQEDEQSTSSHSDQVAHL
jgi:hypothetical protein